MATLGGLLGIMLVDQLIKTGMKENYTFLIYVLVFLLSGLLQHIFVEEVELPEKVISCEYVKETYTNLKAFLVIKKNLLWMLNYLFLFNFYYLVVDSILFCWTRLHEQS